MMQPATAKTPARGWPLRAALALLVLASSGARTHLRGVHAWPSDACAPAGEQGVSVGQGAQPNLPRVERASRFGLAFWGNGAAEWAGLSPCNSSHHSQLGTSACAAHHGPIADRLRRCHAPAEPHPHWGAPGIPLLPCRRQDHAGGVDNGTKEEEAGGPAPARSAPSCRDGMLAGERAGGGGRHRAADDRAPCAAAAGRDGAGGDVPRGGGPAGGAARGLRCAGRPAGAGARGRGRRRRRRRLRRAVGADRPRPRPLRRLPERLRGENPRSARPRRSQLVAASSPTARSLPPPPPPPRRPSPQRGGGSVVAGTPASPLPSMLATTAASWARPV
eukprot:scaffold442_cov397-Prasinococcus_capsulatus_cf.AAC.17